MPNLNLKVQAHPAPAKPPARRRRLASLEKMVRESRLQQSTAKRRGRQPEDGLPGSMAEQIAHEIRNAIGGIAGFAALLERDLADMPASIRLLKKIGEGTARLEAMAINLGIFAQKSQPELVTMNAEDAFTHAMAFCRARLAENWQEVEIIQPGAGDSVPIEVDLELFRVLVYQLVHALAKLIRRGSEIHLQTEARQRELRVRLFAENDLYEAASGSDSGKNAAARQAQHWQKRAFTRALVQKILDLHGWWMRSVNLQGDELHFEFAIPIKDHTTR